LDIERLKGLARRFLDRMQPGAGSNPFAVNAFAEKWQMEWKANADEREKEKKSEAGICGGMVAVWVCDYLIFGDPRTPPDRSESIERQMHVVTTAFKRTMMDKPDPVSTGRTKVYADKNLSLTNVLANVMPTERLKYENVTSEIAGELMPGKPLLLSVAIGTGRHALGLILDNASFYVLEPNRGVFCFSTRHIFERELNNYLVQNLLPLSRWELMQIYWKT
jgi:hypothetical protein